MDVPVAPPPVRPAGFWIRAAAALVDFAIFGLVELSLERLATWIWGPVADDAAPLRLTVGLFAFLFTLAYTTVLHAWGGQTIGKLVVGVWVVAADGGPLPAGAALLRYFAYYVSLLTLTLGFVIAGLRPDKRALHDLIAGSRVVRRAPPAAATPATPPPDVAVAAEPTPEPAAPEPARPPGGVV
jgi:uncharacterized RDD family membrane protein YckC